MERLGTGGWKRRSVGLPMAPRTFKITKEDAEKHGYTRGCPGCYSWFEGRARQRHTPQCRARFEAAMKEEAKVKRAAEQKAEFERRLEPKRKKREEREERKRRKA